MQNFIFISPNFPELYYKFVKSLKNVGFRVLGIGDAPWDELPSSLREDLTEYYCVYGNMEDIERVAEAVRFFENKYGHIDYLESNNEYWLEHDAILRERFNITTGLYPKDMEHIKFKSKMKECFLNAGAKVAKFHLVDNYENCKKFIEEVNYPVFVKPDNGVGADLSFRINNDDELKDFIDKYTSITQFIMEQFIKGSLISFDGICDDEGNVLVAFNEHFPTPVDLVVNNDLDDYYYASLAMPKDFYELGVKVVKAFAIKKRCFHIEFFRLDEDIEGLGKKGDVFGLECNMRPPGGDTPDLLSIALDDSFYDAYAHVMMFNTLKNHIKQKTYLSISVARKDHFSYVHTHEEILAKYQPYIVEFGRYKKSIALAMGDSYYFARFANEEVEIAIEFAKFVQEKIS